MKSWLQHYIDSQCRAVNNIPLDEVSKAIDTIKNALNNNQQIFVIGNGGSASNASHFATDLGKGSSDRLDKRFKVTCLNDNNAWITAIANDYCYDDIFWRQLQNFSKKDDILIIASVSGNSPNIVKTVEWANLNNLYTIALVGEKKGNVANIANLTITAEDSHYGRVEDIHMQIFHMISYYFIESATNNNTK